MLVRALLRGTGVVWDRPPPIPVSQSSNGGVDMKWLETMHVPWYVLVSAVFVTALALIRILAYAVEGHDDPVLTYALTGVIGLFTGSFAVARALTNGQPKDGKDDHAD